nr:MAG TPA: hypothetical protein [Caudoviricetes sp.]
MLSLLCTSRLQKVRADGIMNLSRRDCLLCGWQSMERDACRWGGSWG